MEHNFLEKKKKKRRFSKRGPIGKGNKVHIVHIPHYQKLAVKKAKCTKTNRYAKQVKEEESQKGGSKKPAYTLYFPPSPSTKIYAVTPHYLNHVFPREYA